MSDRKYYQLSSNSEFNYEMNTYLTSARVRPPMALLKKLLINLTLDRQHFRTDKIVPFVCEILRQWKDVAGICEIGYRVLDMYGIWNDVDAVNCVLEMPDDDQRWSVLANIDVKTTDRDVLKYVSDSIYNHVLDVGLYKPQKVRLCVRVLEKLSFLGEGEKIDKIMDMLYVVIGDEKLTESVCDVLIDLNDRMKNVDIKIVVNRTYVEKIISNVKGAPSVFTLLTKYKLLKEDDELKKNVINWALPYIQSGNFPIVMNSIKCVLYYSDKTVNLLPEILKGLDKMIEEGGMTIGYKRTLLFDVLRNMILLIVEYGSYGFDNFTKKYVSINEDVDVEPYIVDTKLELMYLLSLHGGDEERKLINEWLLELSMSSNEELSYKSIRTVGNLYMRQEGICDSIMMKLVETLSIEKHLLTLGIALREVGGCLAHTYVNKVKERREEVHYTIGENMWKDDDIIGYLGTLAVIGDIDELLSLQESLWKRVWEKDTRVMMMDAYVNALVRGYISSGGNRKEDVIAVLHRARDEMGPIISKRVNTLLTISDVAVLDSNANTANRREPAETPLAVSVDSLGTLACLYMRSL